MQEKKLDTQKDLSNQDDYEYNINISAQRIEPPEIKYVESVKDLKEELE